MAKNIAVIGAGPVGIYLSKLLLSDGHRVTLIESGSRDSESKKINYSTYVQVTPTSMPTGVHKVGGGSNQWHGRIGEFIESDFQSIPDLRLESWPFGLEELRPYYDALSFELEGIVRSDFELVAHEFKSEISSLPSSLELRPFRYIDPNHFLKLFQELETNPNFSALLETTCEKIEENKAGEVSLSVVNKNQSISLNFELCVIAAGTFQSVAIIERSKEKLGNIEKKVIGRYLMDHFDTKIGTIYIGRRNAKFLRDLALNEKRLHSNIKSGGVSITLNQKHLLSGEFLNASIEFIPFAPNLFFEKYLGIKKLFPLMKAFYNIERIIRFAYRLVRNLLEKYGFLATRFTIWLKGEELPYYESQIGLADGDLQSFLLHHKHYISEKTHKSLIKTLEAIAEIIQLNNLGTIRYRSTLYKKYIKTFSLGPNWHAMGGLRMGTDSSSSICDSNGKIHGVKNCFVTGAAVFPTGSNANPTYTGLALAARLAAHISRD